MESPAKSALMITLMYAVIMIWIGAWTMVGYAAWTINPLLVIVVILAAIFVSSWMVNRLIRSTFR